jgi:uncharacterized protein YlxP (DUF503 family)
MIVGIIKLRLRLPENHSLKGKRRIVKSLIGQVRGRFNVAVSEIGFNDLWQITEIGMSTIGNSQPIINSALDKILEFIGKTYLVEIIDTDIEIIHMGK